MPLQISKYQNHNATRPQVAEIVVNDARVLLNFVEMVSIVTEVETIDDSVLRHLGLEIDMAGEGVVPDPHIMAGGKSLS